MFTKILIPVDLGHLDRTDSMMESVKSIATQAGVEITLLTVLPEVPAYVAVQMSAELIQGATAEAKIQIDALAKTHGMTEMAAVKVTHGHPSQTILNIAKEEQSDLIVIGSHKPGVSDYLLGSVASRVVRHAMCSVIIVR